tara:strand:+ start:341 stop:1690 length:1350 start_codon:yes stop_codon:yes gene_type:complete
VFNKVLVANRGAVASRVLRALSELDIKSVAVYSQADEGAPYLDRADEAFLIGESPPQKSYLNQEALLALIRQTNCDGVHPGYGFLAENSTFAEQVNAIGAHFIGPSPKWLRTMGHKTKSIDFLAQHGMPVNATTAVLDSEEQFVNHAQQLGYPVLIKPAAGGGGIGMLVATDEKSLVKQLSRARSMAERSFSSSEIYLERQLTDPRHIEVQILADTEGGICHLFERDCSIQRRNQKIIEEARAPNIDPNVLTDLLNQVTDAIGSIGYDNIGTVEMLRSREGQFSFLEMNTRLQVEHGVTEELTGIDIVQAQIRLASGMNLDSVLPERPRPNGHAIEARIYAEDPVRFFPSPGTLERFRLPEAPNVRVETGYREGMKVTPFYDPLLAKIIINDVDRATATKTIIEALASCEIAGLKSNVPALITILESEQFQTGRVHTGLTSELIHKKSN